MSSESSVKEITKQVVEPVDVGVCVICQESIADNDDQRTVVNLRCNHVFHLDYVERLFAKSFNSLHSPYEPNHVPSPYDPNHVPSPYDVNPMQPPYALDQIRDIGIMRYGIWRIGLSLEVWLEHQVDEHIPLIVDSQHRLQRMMYEYQCITGGIGIDGESSGGGDGDSSSGGAMAEEEVEMMEE
ncbi:hypothetical protein CARUB_v10006244mg [Capsella rubella]|uniref:RING-type domain-containing protein n=1 Tax=Capsella rubella TaxID=81985 RepID=R0F2V8_9BRAS|nr:hypothetical protein CARUB_v10006244mg [Capsella rubella]